MKILVKVLLILVSCGAAAAQNASSPQQPSEVLAKRTWDLGFFTGGGTGLAGAADTRFVYAGGRVGRILTNEHFSGWLRGNLEWAVDLMPSYAVFPPNRAVYGGSFKPFVWQWNFTSDKRIAPYAAVAGGILFDTADIPPGNTSNVNFTSQGAVGANFFTKRGQALRLEAAIVHLSNGGLGKQNPGYGASLLFTIGYSWFKATR